MLVWRVLAQVVRVLQLFVLLVLVLVLL